MINKIKIIIGFLLLLTSFSSQSEIVTTQITPSIKANAEYRSDDASGPLLIFLHGFLQTRDFSTVRRLSNALYDNGYSVLSVNLSLGISDRRSSLPCESIHLHTLQDDSNEIKHWVNWAKQKGHKDIILVGHSAGSVSISAYLASHFDPVVKKTILISLTYYGPGRPAANEKVIHAEKAQKMLAENNQQISDFALNYCKKYITTAAAFMSYYNWTKNHIIDALVNSTSENYVIIGAGDQRIDKAWIDELQTAKAHVTLIDEANHFFDMTHEFDLVDSVEAILTEGH